MCETTSNDTRKRDKNKKSRKDKTNEYQVKSSKETRIEMRETKREIKKNKEMFDAWRV